MDTVTVWIYLKVEVATDGGLAGNYWLMKPHEFFSLPPIGLELDYQSRVRETVVIDRLFLDPDNGMLRGLQQSWLSIGVGELVHWEAAGWEKRLMTEEEVQANKE